MAEGWADSWAPCLPACARASKASLRILFVLSGLPEGLNVTALFKVMSARFGVGRPATESSHKALLGAGLVEVLDRKVEGRSFKVVKLTAKGLRVAIKNKEIVSIFQVNDEMT